MGDSVKYCCCITGSTEAATELVESATLRRTLTAIQSLMEQKRLVTVVVETAGLHLLEEEFQYLECTKRRVTADCLFTMGDHQLRNTCQK